MTSLASLVATPAATGERIVFAVYGTPRPKGSHRAFIAGARAIVAPASRGERAWRETVSAIAVMAMDGYPPLEGPVTVTLDFFELRPKGHFRRSGALKPGAQVRPTKAPDLDKLMRSVGDALNGVVWRDDSQVCEATIRKRYTSEAFPRAGVLVTVERFTGEP